MDKTITGAPFYSKLMRFHSYNYNFDALNSSELSGSQEQSVKLCLSARSWRNMRWKSHPLFWVHDDISTKKNQIVKADLLPLMTRPTNWLIFQKKPWDNGIFDELLPQKICQIILYKCIIQEKENMYILNLFQFNEKYYFLMLTLLVFADD